MSGPFDEGRGPFLALVNDEQQYSLWPAATPVPPGWRVAFGPAARADCLDFVTRTWTDQRPASLRAAHG